jgi:NlpC/P60 family/Transglycosylase SLT domain
LLVTDTAGEPTLVSVQRLLHRAGVVVGLAQVQLATTGSGRRQAVSAIRDEVREFDPQAVLVAAPAGAGGPVRSLLDVVPARVPAIWAQDPTAATLRSARLSAGSARLLTARRSLSIVSPGSILDGTKGLVRSHRLTAKGVRAYARSLLLLLSSSFRLPKPLPGLASDPDAAGTVAVAAAESRIGDPYVWGGAGPTSFDCSGLVMWAWAHAGVALPHYSGSQYDETIPISLAQLEPGDLLFPADPGEHVAMYVGDGKIIQASEPGQPVGVIPLADTGHFFVSAREVVPGAVTDVAAVGAAQSYAYQLVVDTAGWGASQWPYLDALWERESGWQVNATNPRSGAYGITQALPAGKMASAGSDWRTNPDTQIDWGISYILARYGTPQEAWAHEIQFGWY